MKRMLLLLASVIGFQVAADYTHIIKIDNHVKNTPGTYEFMANTPAYRFTLKITDGQKLSITARHNVDVMIIPKGLQFSFVECLSRITLNITDGKLKNKNFEITPSLIHRSAFGPSSCTGYLFGMSMDTQGNLRFRELPQ